MSQNPNLEAIEKEIETLCRLRDSLLKEDGVYERYLVFNNKTGKLDDNTWVLSSQSDTDRTVLEDLVQADTYPLVWRDRIQSWLQDEELRHTDYDVEDI